jgi:hypothetical protein
LVTTRCQLLQCESNSPFFAGVLEWFRWG